MSGQPQLKCGWRKAFEPFALLAFAVLVSLSRPALADTTHADTASFTFDTRIPSGTGSGDSGVLVLDTRGSEGLESSCGGNFFVLDTRDSSFTGAPTITQQPLSQNANAGANVTLTVVASGVTPLAYQWLRDEQIVAGATNASLTINNARASDCGSYMVFVANPFGATASVPAHLAVLGGETYTQTVVRMPTPATPDKPAGKDSLVVVRTGGNPYGFLLTHGLLLTSSGCSRWPPPSAIDWSVRA